MRTTIASAATVLALAACGGAAPPTVARTEAVSAIRSAGEVGAEREPRASYHLELAREALERADALIDQGRMEPAKRALWRAEADAELALALTREARIAADAEALRERIRDMREARL